MGPRTSLEDFRLTIDHYLVGTFNVLRLAAAAIGNSEPGPDGERGVIINTASIAGYEATIGQVAYASAKGGVIGMTLAAARDLAVVGIRVMTIAPGTFITPAYGADPEQVEAYWAPAVPFPKRMGQPAEYAAPGRVDHRELLSQRRGHPHRRRHPVRAEEPQVTTAAPAR